MDVPGPCYTCRFSQQLLVKLKGELIIDIHCCQGVPDRARSTCRLHSPYPLPGKDPENDGPIGGTMADDKTNRGAQDRARVAGGEAYEVKHLAEKFGVTEQAVQDAISRVGNSREKVEAELREQQKKG